jgi:Zn-dependent protease with chaperone function
MNFFEAQAQSRSRTRRLIFVMALAFIAVVASVVAVITAVAWLAVADYGTSDYLPFLISRPALPIWTAAGTALFIAIASLFRITTLRQGGGKVAGELGGTLIGAGERELLRSRLRNVVEEMAIASGVPTPEVYVLDHEPGINAFAAGFTPDDAAIAVTRGTLETLNRDELQAVIAHEFSHIFNGDMRLNIQLMGPMFGILAIGLLGRVLLRNTRMAGQGRGKNNGAVAALALGAGLAITGYVGLLLARLIKAGVSRQREYLADASAVQFTRQTSGIAGALKKIAGYKEKSRISANGAEEVSHMLFASGLSSIGGLLATHPPLFNRISAIEPGFTRAEYDALQSTTLPDALPEEEFSHNNPVQAFAALPETHRISVNELLDTVGQPDEAHYAAARYFASHIPESISAALASSYQVVLLLPALMLHSDAGRRARQLAYLQQQVGRSRCDQIELLHNALQTIEGEPRLAFMNLALPLIKQQPRNRLQYLDRLLEQLAMQDNELELFEFMLLRVFRSYIRHTFNPGKARNWKPLRDSAMQAAAAELLAAFCETGHNDPAAATRALRRGIARLGAEPPAVRTGSWADATDAALLQLEDCLPRDRETVVAALMDAALDDGRISQPESELLRAICAILECPLPPVIAAI